MHVCFYVYINENAVLISPIPEPWSVTERSRNLRYGTKKCLQDFCWDGVGE